MEIFILNIMSVKGTYHGKEVMVSAVFMNNSG